MASSEETASATRKALSLTPILPETAMEALAQGVTVLTANQRLGRLLRGRYDRWRAKSGQETWSGADLVMWAHWCRRQWEDGIDAIILDGERKPGLPVQALRRCLTGSQAQLVMEGVIAASKYGRVLPSPASLAALAKDAMLAWENLRAWRLFPPSASKSLPLECQAFSEWVGAYQRLCSEREWMDETEIPELLGEFFTAGILAPPGRLILVGFDEITPDQQHLLEWLSRQGTVLEAVEWPAQQGSAKRVAFNDFQAEVHGAARWARKLLEDDPTREIGIVVPDLRTHRSLILRVFEDVLCPNAVQVDQVGTPRPFNISLGLPLSGYPLIDAALGLLSLSPRQQPWEKIHLLLHTPFVAGASGESDSRAFAEIKLWERGGDGAFLRALQSLLQPQSEGPIPTSSDRISTPEELDSSLQVQAPILGEALGRWRSRYDGLETRMPPSAWARAFGLLLKDLGWPGDRPLNSVEFQTLKKWKALLDDFSRLDPVAKPMAQGEALSKFSRMAEDMEFQPEGSDSHIQILGRLEAAGLECDYLWLMGVHNEAWPSIPRPTPFLPLAFQRRHGLPNSSVGQTLEMALTMMARLRSAAPEMIAGYPKVLEDREVAPSPLITRFPEVKPIDLETDSGAVYLDCIAREGRLEPFTDFQGPVIPTGSDVPGGTGLFADQAACPFRAFARLRLQALAPEMPEDGLTPMDRGSLVHRALEKAWGGIGDHATLCALTPSDLRSRMEAAADEALAEFRERRAEKMGARAVSLEQSRMVRLLTEWMEIEKLRAPFRVEKREVETTFEIGGISVKGRIDRIDQVDNGERIILDYKTGRLKPNSWMGERPEEPQLPLYCVSANYPLAGVAFAGLRRESLGFQGLTGMESLLPQAKLFDSAANPGEEALGSKAALLNQWKRVLESLGDAFRRGDARVDPKDGQTCNYCDLGTFCRITDLQEGLALMDQIPGQTREGGEDA